VTLWVLDTQGLGDDLERVTASTAEARVGTVLRLVAIVGNADSTERLARLRSAGVTATVVEPVGESELRAAVAGEAAASGARDGSELRKLNVLVAEDGEVNREVLRGLLESRGHGVEIVNDGEAAVAAAGRGGHDVALLDLELPLLSGVEVARRIRAAEQGGGRRLQIVALTAHASAASRQESLEAGMDDFLTKPITATRLFEVLGRARAAAALHRAVADGAPSDRGSIDWSAALRYCGGQETLLRGLVSAATEQIPKLLRECRESVAGRDGDRLRRAAHTLKSTLGYFGALDLRQRAEDLEAAAWEARFGTAAELLDGLDPGIAAVLRELEGSPEREAVAAARKELAT
jgi:CheY-like chemotaxis protein